jgi:4-amino-4-deoxy-L-arabinose transferase-like glycosyltransferase
VAAPSPIGYSYAAVRVRAPSLSPWVWAALAAAFVIVLQTTTLAACGPWDPWETHYGEVARQILVRHDPIDLWWKPGYGPSGNAENVFWSKPALPFWLMALSMKILGVGAGPAADEMVRGALPVLAIRLPSMIAGWLSAAFLGYVTCRLGQVRAKTDAAKRSAANAGILVALILSLMPQWAIVTRQALTDMFFVGPVTLAMGAWAMAWLQPDRELRRWTLPLKLRGRSLSVPLVDRAYLTFGILFLLAVIAPLAALDLHVLSEETRRRVAGFIKRPDVPNVRTLWEIHLHLIIYWVFAGLTFAASLLWRRRSQAWMGVLYLAAGLSLLGKGLIGPGLIGLLVLADMAVSSRFHLLRRCGLPTGALLFALASFPWHHAMVLYRGERFFNELIILNNLARFGSGEQEQAVGGFTFYLHTLGLAALPWVAALPAALWRALRPDDDGDDEPTAQLRRFALLWLAVSLLLLTYSVTKYYHYLLPALPPMAVLLGLWLGGSLSGRARTWLKEHPQIRWLAAALGIGLIAAVVRDAIHEPAWIVHLTTYLYTLMWREGTPPVDILGWLSLPFAAGLVLWALLRPRLAAAAMICSSVAVSTWLFAVYLPKASEHWSQRSAIATYYDNRADGDPLLSYWFYYRGETFLSKADVWVSKEAKRDKLREFIDLKRGVAENLWLITTKSHMKRVSETMLPRDVKDGAVLVYENAHYELLKIPLPPPER